LLEAVWNWLLMPFVCVGAGLLYTGWRMTSTLPMPPTPPTPPGGQFAREYRLECLPGVTVLALPPEVQRVHAVCVEQANYHIMLTPVDQSAWLHPPYRGRPSWFCVRFNGSGLELEVGPVPDGPYRLRIGTLEDSPPTGLCEPVEVAFRYPRGDPAALALALLRSWLTPEQNRMLADEQCFLVKGGTTGSTYRIKSGVVFNVHQLNKHGQRIFELCFAPHKAPYIGDVMLAQKITLEHNEREAWRVANYRATT
jgi:hypothetical protein